MCTSYHCVSLSDNMLITMHMEMKLNIDRIPKKDAFSRSNSVNINALNHALTKARNTPTDAMPRKTF